MTHRANLILLGGKMEKNYLIDGNFRKILLRIIDDPFGKTRVADLCDLIPFEVPNAEEIFIEDGRCFVRHSNVYVTYFYTDGQTLDNYELIKRIVMVHNVYLYGNDEKSKAKFVEDVKNLLLKVK